VAPVVQGWPYQPGPRINACTGGINAIQEVSHDREFTVNSK